MTAGESRILLADRPGAMERDYPLADGCGETLARWRARVGEVLTLYDGAGGYYRGRLLPDRRMVRLFARLPDGIEPPDDRCLAQALPDKERMLWIIQKAVELGATRIQPLLTRHGHPAPGVAPGQDKSATWERVALGAARQCRRGVIPEIAALMTLEDFLRQEEGRRVHLDLAGEPLGALAATLAQGPLTLLTGPEGGWGGEERERLHQSGSRAVTLGARVLRTETAGAAALAVLAAADAVFT